MNLTKDSAIIYGVTIAAALVFLPRLLGKAAVQVVESAGDVVNTVADEVADVVQNNSPFPDTRTPESKSLCEQAIDNGDDFKASFYCPASEWFGGLFDGEWF